LAQLDGRPAANWNERAAVYLLAGGIIAMGIAPFLVTDFIYPATDFILQQLSFK
jgi:NADH:ubiquinone oxidoreductase subunit 4 (subunit M)